MKREFDPILLEVLWNRLISIVNEQAAALIRASFTTIVREVEDLSAGIFTPDADMIAQAVTGTPGHINTMANAARNFLKRYPKDQVKPGDVLITNDPWLASGHRNDLTTLTPIFKKNSLVGWSSSCCHSIDIGGVGFSADTRDVFEEGLGIPILKIFKEGKPNHDVIDIIKANVRMPMEVMGDIMAQISSQDVCATKLCELMDQYQLDSIEPLAGAIFDYSERAMRRAIEKIPEGDYHHEVFLDGFDEPMKISVTINVKGKDLAVDYTGTSLQIKRGINVPLNYTHAYTTYPLKAVINPEVPNNEGSFRPIRVMAPEGCFLNAQFPFPVMGRHLSGHFCVAAVMGALEKIIPERTIGDGGGAACPQWFGYTKEGRIFASIYFFSGGMGARFNRDGIHALNFPTNTKNAPIEVIESTAPLFFEKKEILPDTGGVGEYRGGCGQSIAVKVTSPYPAIISGLVERTKFPAKGRQGGKEGKVCEFVIRDKYGKETKPNPKSKQILTPGSTVIINHAGGGGYGPGSERNPEAVLEDVIQGYVSAKSAKMDYKVVINDKNADFCIDREKTKRIRNKIAKSKWVMEKVSQVNDNIENQKV
jgi:N-methylhydantoinase B